MAVRHQLIRRPPQVVWAVLTDPNAYSEWVVGPTEPVHHVLARRAAALPRRPGELLFQRVRVQRGLSHVHLERHLAVRAEGTRHGERPHVPKLTACAPSSACCFGKPDKQALRRALS